MKLRLSSSILLFALTIPAIATATAPGKFYAGLFGGAGSSNDFNATQLGTAYFIEAAGGPLSVNAFGQLGSESSAFFGMQLGYQGQEILFTPSSQWTLAPAVELEGFTMNESTFNADLINNTTRLPEHDFQVSYPMSRNIFLGNAVFSFNHPRLVVHPYIGLGIGGAIVRISGADATQISPPEAGINHYNSNDSDTTTTFAGQIKLGLGYDINKYITVFADYRWLYLGNTNFVFGSTVYPTHAETSSWQVKLDSQRYNMGNIGVRFNLS